VVDPEGFGWVGFRVKEGSDEEAALASEAFGGTLDFHNADLGFVRDFFKFLFSEAVGWFEGFGPSLETVVGGEFFAFGSIAVAALMEADDTVDALFFQSGEGVVGAKAPVGEKNGLFF
jgi:hypothetical protein